MSRSLSMVCASMLLALPARANDAVGRCLEAHESGQRDALEGKLSRAIEAYRVCSQEVCPKLVRRDCAGRLSRAERDLPTVLVEVRGAAAGDLNVTIDGGDPIALTGAPIPVDPGKHRLRVEAADGRSAEQELELSPGQRDVAVVLELEPIRAPEAEPTAPSDTSDETPTVVYVLGGVAVVGVAGFVGFGLAGNGKKSELDECKPSCTDKSVYDDMQRNYLFADIALGLGVASAAVATYIYLNRDQEGPRVGIRPARDGGFLTWESRF